MGHEAPSYIPILFGESCPQNFASETPRLRVETCYIATPMFISFPDPNE